MKKLLIHSNFFPNQLKGKMNLFYISIFSFCLLFLSVNLFGQAGDLSQIRNGDGKLHKVQGQNVWDTCGKCWVNGNAGESNAHLREDYSIPYRSLITGLTPGVCYEYELGYDTYHSAMAIDFLTHYQRLEPHGPFGHDAEVVNPLIFLNGSTEYRMGVLNKNTFPIPPPSPSGITSGSFEKNGTTPKNIQNQPVTRFNALSASEKDMTIWNGTIQYIYYVSEAPIVIGGADAETRMRIRFQADDDSVLLAWGGHIASRLDWGYSGLDNKGNPIPLSAGGINGSPYHMRQKNMFTVTCSTTQAPGANPVEISGFGNTDRSLSAAAVFPPPDCPTVPSQTICAGSTSVAFGITSPQANVTYTWSFGSNTLSAIFSGNTTSASGNSVTIVKSGGGAFNTSGTFTLDITALLNGVPQTCPAVATLTVLAPSVSATASSTSNTTSAAGCDATIDRTIGNVSQLSATAGGSPATPFTYQWSDDNNPNGTFSNDAIAAPQYTVTQNGTYTVKVVARDAFGCTAQKILTICVVGASPQCVVSGPGPICPGTTNVYKYDPDNNGVADPIPANFTAAWTLPNNSNGASITNGATTNTVTIQSSSGNCNSSYTVRITLTSTSGLISTNCEKTVSVVDQTAPTLSGCPGNVTVDFCSIPAPAGVTATDNCPAPGTPVIVTFLETRSNGQNGCSNVITRKWTASDACGNTATCGQTITVVDQDPPLITCPPSVTIKFADSKDDLTKTGAAFASDNCAIANGFPSYTDNPASPAGGTTFTRTWRVQDASGNTASCSQSITREAQPVQRITGNQPTAEVSTASTGEKPAELKVKAFPNPFTDQVNFRFTPTVSGTAKMELFDMTGRRLSTVQIGYVQAGVERSVTYRVPGSKRVSMFYRININNQSGKGLLISGSKGQ